MQMSRLFSDLSPEVLIGWESLNHRTVPLNLAPPNFETFFTQWQLLPEPLRPKIRKLRLWLRLSLWISIQDVLVLLA